jgi:hypothetical protein
LIRAIRICGLICHKIGYVSLISIWASNKTS